ncbi:MAG: class I SAM-dependent methyltransferase [Chloroflexi bacterium]|nr:class I SAM-dependent methyltransferase [Chloroflexota bacterium]
MTRPSFAAYWESTLKPGTRTELAEHWRQYVMSGVERGRQVLRAVQAVRPGTAVRVLDVGCGYGGASIAFALDGAHVTGIDLSHTYMAGARIRAAEHGVTTIAFAESVLEALPFSTGAFDVIICSDVLEHVKDQRACIREIARVLAPHGVAYLSFPNLLSLDNLKSDPHFQLFGASVLPPRIGEWYVRRRGRLEGEYGVGRFPVARRLRGLFQREGMQVVWQNPMLRRNLGMLTVVVCELLTNTYPLVEWIVEKCA